MPTKYILLVSLLSLVLVNVPFARSECYDTNNVFDPTQRYISSCPQTNDLPKTDPQLSIVSDTSPEKGKGDMIQIMFSCDEKKPELCEKGRRGFQNAAKYITEMIDFKAPVVLNATFAQICGTFIKCDPKKPPFPLGAAGPDRLVPLKDDDGETRLYPQALVKQLQLANHPEYSSVDIQAVFNSEASTFWFRGDPEIGKDQVDFELVVVHEVIHGLGFLSSWDEYINVDNPTGLTPFPPFLIRPDDSSPVNGTITFTGFQEFPFDRFLTLTADNTPLSSITKRINQFSGTVFANDKEFDKAFINSEQYTECQRMLLNSATRNSIAFKISDDESYPIETSLSPFRSGSSMGHLDFDTFNNTLDFLMRWKAPRQVTLDDLTSVNGNNPDYPSPMGPKTLEILEALGYSLKDNPKPLKKNKDLENLKSNTGSINTNTLSLLSLLSFIVTILIL